MQPYLSNARGFHRNIPLHGMKFQRCASFRPRRSCRGTTNSRCSTHNTSTKARGEGTQELKFLKSSSPAKGSESAFKSEFRGCVSETLTLSLTYPHEFSGSVLVIYVEPVALKNPLALPGMFPMLNFGRFLLILFLPGAEVNREALVITYDKLVSISIHPTHIAL